MNHSPTGVNYRKKATLPCSAGNRPCAFKQIFSLIGAADEGGGGDRAKSQGKRLLFQLGKLLGRQIANHLKMRLGRLEILTDGEDIATNCAQIPHERYEFLPALAESQP